MEYYCEMKVNDKATGELLEKVNMLTGCDDCETADEFDKAHSEDCFEFLRNLLKGDYDDKEVCFRLDIVQLADDFEDDDEDEEDAEVCE